MATAQQRNSRDDTSKSTQPSGGGSSRGPGPAKVAISAAEQLAQLTSRDVESVIGLERTDDGWKVRLEVVESRRIPDSADILALYEIEVDRGAEMTGYRRLRRYGRGQTGDDHR